MKADLKKEPVLRKFSKFGKNLSRTQVIALGFLLIILAGSLILMLPAASRQGTVTPFLDCLFTAVSATCVTGLIVVDTYQHWSMFGQVILLLLIQVGGLGFMTFATMVTASFRRS